ncbi:MAG: hypothetical protein ACYTX0_43965 [Nostoc sp.]
MYHLQTLIQGLPGSIFAKYKYQLYSSRHLSSAYSRFPTSERPVHCWLNAVEGFAQMFTGNWYKLLTVKQP